MTKKQKDICYYRSLGYSPRHCSIIAGVSDSYARRIINAVEEFDVDGYSPDINCVLRRKILDHIVDSAGYVFIPNSEKYSYISLLGYLGFTHGELKALFPEDKGQFIYMALHRSDKAWRNLRSDFMGVDQEDYDFLLGIKHKNC